MKILLWRVRLPYAKEADKVFEAIDNPALRPLPYTQYVYSDYVIRRTPANYHVEYDDFHYSVPHELYKQLVTIRATATTIEILNDNRE